ncbi:MAG: ABC transporter ATP-binding protein [Gemmataceae bacterium]
MKAISASSISKKYMLGGAARANSDTLTDALAAAPRNLFKKLKGESRHESNEFWALRDVSFEIKPGEAVGIIGKNGAGKSTLLKVLSRIVEPTGGRIELRGRVGSLLEVGTGFHPELTGRENVFLNGSILGMSRREIARNFDAIVAFAGVEKFLDTPVKRYSSGMYVRLAFAVAAHLEPEILIVDEVLAVGDAEFQARCLGKMKDVSRSGRTILFVSHSMAAVQNLCTRAVLLAAGTVVRDGPPATVIDEYNRATLTGGGAEADLSDHRGRIPGSNPTMRRIRVCDDSDGRTPFVPVHGTARLEIDFTSDHPLDSVDLGFVVKDRHQAPVFGINTKVCPAPVLKSAVRSGRVTARIPRMPLMPGAYSIDLYFGSRGRDFDTVLDAAELTVVPADVFGTGRLPPPECGPVCQPALWEIHGSDA